MPESPESRSSLSCSQACGDLSRICSTFKSRARMEPHLVRVAPGLSNRVPPNLLLLTSVALFRVGQTHRYTCQTKRSQLDPVRKLRKGIAMFFCPLCFAGHNSEVETWGFGAFRAPQNFKAAFRRSFADSTLLSTVWSRPFP